MANKATLINAAGNKVVVESDSAQAKNYFSQGYKLMTTPTVAPAPAANTNVNNGSAAKATLVNSSGAKVVVQSGSQQAKDYFGQGYSLMGDKTAELNAKINGEQEADQQRKAAEADGAPGTSKSAQAMKDLETMVKPDTAKPAEPPKLLDSFNALKSSYGVGDLETQLNDLKNSEELLRSEATARKDNAESKPVALGVIGGRQSEIDRQTDKQLTENLRQQNYLTNQLKTKYDIISNVMNFQQKDYENATAAYDKEFSQNIQLLQQVRADETASMNEENIKLDNARADYTIFINSIKDGSLDITDLTPSQKAILTKLEVQQGLPTGTYEMLAPKTAGKTLTSLGTDNNSSGGRSAYFMTVDKKTGTPTILSVPLPGAVSTKTGGGGDSDDEKEIDKFRGDAADYITKLDNGEMGWATAYDSLKAKYPTFSSQTIDNTLGGGLNPVTNQPWGRAISQ